MKVLLLGGGGFIGSSIADRLLLDGHQVRIFERPRVVPYREFTNHEILEWMPGDFLSQYDIETAVSGMDAVIHLASATLPKNSSEDPLFDIESNLLSTVHLLNIMRDKECKRIIFASSGGTVYGVPEYLPIDEKHPTNPIVSYGIVKLAIEKYLLLYKQMYGMKPVILRVANPYGPRQRIETAQGAVMVFLHHGISGREIQIWGDGTVTRDYLYIDDVVDAFSKSLLYDGDEAVFNISSGRGTSLNELVETIETVIGKILGRKNFPGRVFDVPASILSNVLAQKELGWIPDVSLSEGIQRTLSWIKSSGAAR